MTRKVSIVKIFFKILSYCIVVFAAAMVIIPLAWVVMTSLKANNEVIAGPYVLPEVLQFDNYVRAFEKAQIGQYFLNTVLLVIVSMTLLLLLSVPAAYSISRIRFKGSKALLSTYIGCMFLQVNVLLVPIFLLVTDIGLYDTRLIVWVILATLQVPFSTFLLTNYMKNISKDYDHAAMIDGANHWRIMWHVIIPQSKPAIATVAVLSFMSFFNEYILTYILISDQSKWTIAVGITNLFEVEKTATDWSAMFASLVLVMIPTIIVYIIGQKALLGGMNVGGLKE